MASFVISKRLSGHYKFEFTPERKDNFTSNAYELRMDSNQRQKKAAVGFRDVFLCQV
jgi:hypothetical protein